MIGYIWSIFNKLMQEVTSLEFKVMGKSIPELSTLQATLTVTIGLVLVLGLVRSSRRLLCTE